jgi:hypothetical protein
MRRVIDFDAGQDAHGGEPFPQLVDHVELFAQPFRGQAVGDGQPRRVIGQGAVLVPE